MYVYKLSVNLSTSTFTFYTYLHYLKIYMQNIFFYILLIIQIIWGWGKDRGVQIYSFILIRGPDSMFRHTWGSNAVYIYIQTNI